MGTPDKPPPVGHATHEVINQPPVLENHNLFETDTPLKEAVQRGEAGWAVDELAAFGATLGPAEMAALAEAANRNPPELALFDRYGHRRDEVTFHPAYHTFMAMSMAQGLHCAPWAQPRPGAMAARGAGLYLMAQVESGHVCPITMTHASVPTLKHQPDIAAEWLPRLYSRAYDPAFRPAAEKQSATIGMGMTEKQGGTDVRTNTSTAVPLGSGGPGEEYRLTGHKWFLSAPMCDAFLMLAQAPGGLSCFFVPRFTPDGTLNALRLQRLKDKVGNRSNASSEVEFENAAAWMVGEEGRGVRTIIEMTTYTRLDCALASAGLMRQALVQALHHTRHRQVMGRALIDQPLMRAVLADLALEAEGATALALRLARAFDTGTVDGGTAEAAYRRIMTPAAKFWICKRAPGFIYEAMEALGGIGYVEEAPLGRLYREAPVNSIWEGSGNVMCLDVLRALDRNPESLEALMAELDAVRSGDKRLDAEVRQLKDRLANPGALEAEARRLVEGIVLAVQGALLVRHAPAAVADAFCATRLGRDWGVAYGTLPAAVEAKALLMRAWPA